MGVNVDAGTPDHPRDRGDLRRSSRATNPQLCATDIKLGHGLPIACARLRIPWVRVTTTRRRVERTGVGPLLSLDATRLPIVLVVDPVVASRHTMWRLLNRSFGVLEAPDALRARVWLNRRPNIDALVVQRELPDAYGSEFVTSLAAARVAVASRTIVVERPVDLRTLVASLAGWFFSRDAGKTAALLREAERLVS
jgi:hypothetical protein